MLRRLLLISEQSEFKLSREALQLPLELPEGRGSPEYLIGLDDKPLVAAEEVKPCFPDASQVIDGLLAEMRRSLYRRWISSLV